MMATVMVVLALVMPPVMVKQVWDAKQQCTTLAELGQPYWEDARCRTPHRSFSETMHEDQTN